MAGILVYSRCSRWQHVHGGASNGTFRKVGWVAMHDHNCTALHASQLAHAPSHMHVHSTRFEYKQGHGKVKYGMWEVPHTPHRIGGFWHRRQPCEAEVPHKDLDPCEAEVPHRVPHKVPHSTKRPWKGQIWYVGSASHASQNWGVLAPPAAL